MSEQILEKQPRSPLVIVLLIAVAVVLWIGSGVIIPAKEDDDNTHAQGKLNNLQVKEFTATERTGYIQQNAITEPKAFTMIKTEVEGRVIELLAKDGAFLKKGEPILHLDERNHETNLKQAQANLIQKQIKHQSAKAIFNKGLSSKSAFADADAQLKAAESQILQAEIALQNTIIKAPFDGALDHIIPHVGDLLRAGDNVTTFIAKDPMLAVAYVSEQNISKVDKTQPAIVKLYGRPEIKAAITFISSVSNKNTRSFRVDATLDNKDGYVLSGETVTLKVPTGLEKLQKLPFMALSADASGVLTVKTLTDESIVKSYKVQIIEEETDGVWVKGLPEKVNVILMGQSFVNEGEKV